MLCVKPGMKVTNTIWRASLCSSFCNDVTPCEGGVGGASFLRNTEPRGSKERGVFEQEILSGVATPTDNLMIVCIYISMCFILVLYCVSFTNKMLHLIWRVYWPGRPLYNYVTKHGLPLDNCCLFVRK